MRLLDRATCDENHDRFVERVIANETVWYLGNDDGVATSSSNDNEEISILLFWSDAAYARRTKDESFPDHGYEEKAMNLFEFLFRWLPGMSEDGVLAGTNWTHDLIGVENAPFELREEIEGRMPNALMEEHRRRYEEATQNGR